MFKVIADLGAAASIRTPSVLSQAFSNNLANFAKLNIPSPTLPQVRNLVDMVAGTSNGRHRAMVGGLLTAAVLNDQLKSRFISSVVYLNPNKKALSSINSRREPFIIVSTEKINNDSGKGKHHDFRISFNTPSGLHILSGDKFLGGDISRPLNHKSHVAATNGILHRSDVNHNHQQSLALMVEKDIEASRREEAATASLSKGAMRPIISPEVMLKDLSCAALNSATEVQVTQEGVNCCTKK